MTSDPTFEPSAPTSATTSDARGGRRGRRRRGVHMHEHFHFSEHSRGGGRHRARRGAVPVAIFTLLEQRPMHGYEIITELETRSEGRWRPSAGSIYPTLDKLERRGMLTSSEVDGKRQFALTDRGREVATQMREGMDDDDLMPWNQHGAGGRGELRGLMSELAGQARQIGRFGSAEQRAAATDILEDTKRRLYAVLAAPPADPSATPTDTPSDA